MSVVERDLSRNGDKKRNSGGLLIIYSDESFLK
jgi:hypothetical protein